MTTKSKASKEQEAIDSITLLMRHIDSEQGIQELTDNVMTRGKEIMEAQLKRAKDEVRKIENRLKFLDGSPVEEQEATQLKKNEEPYVKSRPYFSTSKIAKEIENGFLPQLAPGTEFLSNDVRDYLTNAWEVSQEERLYNTENGSNVFTSNVRKALGNMVLKSKIKRIKPGLFSKKSDSKAKVLGNSVEWN